MSEKTPTPSFEGKDQEGGTQEKKDSANALRKRILAGAFGGAQTPEAGRGNEKVEMEEGENLGGDTRNDAVAAQRREQMREQLLRGEEIAKGEDVPSGETRKGEVGPDGRAILRKA